MFKDQWINISNSERFIIGIRNSVVTFSSPVLLKIWILFKLYVKYKNMGFLNYYVYPKYELPLPSF